MKCENVWIVECDGIGECRSGDDHHLNFETGTGAVCANDRDIDAVARSLSAESGVITVEPCRSLARTVFFDITEDDDSGFSLLDVSGDEYADDGRTDVTPETLSDVSIAMSVIRTAEFEYTDTRGTTVIQYRHGKFATDSERGLIVIAEELAPRFTS
jgi:hypothetical protein